MAGLYAIIGEQNSDRIAKAAERLKFFPNEQVDIFTDRHLSIAWVSQDPPLLFAPAYHPETGVHIFTSGRVAWDETEWQQAEKMNHLTGGLSNRLILDRYLHGGISAIERHNGSAIVLVWDPRSQRLHCLSDHFGGHPLFLYSPASVEGCVISTFADAIASDSAVKTTPDHVSMAEFLKEWQATPPHTYYNEIKYGGAAKHLCWDLAHTTYSESEYWKPHQDGYFDNLQDTVNQLADALNNAIRIRTLPRLGKTATFISGGMDSRLLLFAAADPSMMFGVNLYDVPNRESGLSQKLCESAGVEYIGFARDKDYYPRWMKKGVSISGAMWSLEDNHFIGTHELLQQLGVSTVLSACSADMLFKGEILDKEFVKIFGKSLPFFRYKNQRVDSFLPYPEYQSPPFPPAFKAEMKQRFSTYFEGFPTHLRSDSDRLKVENRRIFPLCYVPASSGQTMYRAFAYDDFFADRAIADLYSHIPAKWKINRLLWGKVVAKICGQDILDANYGWRPGASTVEKFFVFSRDCFRRRLGKISTVGNQGIATDGSWPNLGWYIQNSPTLRQTWEEAPFEDRQLLKELWGSDPWQTPLEQWAKSPNDFFRFMTLLNYWDLRY
jgi:asparagine synthase (glutamine-hydrolysing)